MTLVDQYFTTTGTPHRHTGQANRPNCCTKTPAAKVYPRSLHHIQQPLPSRRSRTFVSTQRVTPCITEPSCGCSSLPPTASRTPWLERLRSRAAHDPPVGNRCRIAMTSWRAFKKGDPWSSTCNLERSNPRCVGLPCAFVPRIVEVSLGSSGWVFLFAATRNAPATTDTSQGQSIRLDVTPDSPASYSRTVNRDLTPRRTLR